MVSRGHNALKEEHTAISLMTMANILGNLESQLIMIMKRRAREFGFIGVY